MSDQSQPSPSPEEMTPAELWKFLADTGQVQVNIIPDPDPTGLISWGTPVEEPEAEAEPEELPVPQPTCRFFAPSESAVEQTGAEAPPNWPYNRMFKFHACTCPIMNDQGKSGCEMVDMQPHCQYYEPSVPVTLASKRLERKASPPLQRVKLLRNRYDLAIPVYSIVTANADPNGIFADEAGEVVHVVSTSDHGDKAATVATELLDATVNEFGPSKVTDEPVNVKVDPPSYLREKVA